MTAVTTALVMPNFAAPQGCAFGGWIMGQFDCAAGIAGRRIAGRCVTKSIQEFTFHAPLLVGDVLAVHAIVEREGRTSLTLTLEGLREAEDGTTAAVATARFVMVCIDDEGQPRVWKGQDPVILPTI